MKSIIFRKRISTSRELAEVLHEVDQLFSHTHDKYLEVNGEYVVAVEIREEILTDKSIVHDVLLVTEINGKES